MTCIAGVEADGTVYLAGDRCLTRGNSTSLLSHPKIAELWTPGRTPERIVVGVCGHYTAMSGLFTSIRLPQVSPHDDAWVWLQQVFAPWLSRHLTGDHRGHSGQDTECSFLVAFRGRLWRMDGGLAVEPVETGRTVAIGSGGDFASGAMVALGGTLDHGDRVCAGVRAACALDTYCAEPIDRFEVDPPRKPRRARKQR